jgi:hypothetical protein
MVSGNRTRTDLAGMLENSRKPSAMSLEKLTSFICARRSMRSWNIRCGSIWHACRRCANHHYVNTHRVVFVQGKMAIMLNDHSGVFTVPFLRRMRGHPCFYRSDGLLNEGEVAIGSQ